MKELKEDNVVLESTHRASIAGSSRKRKRTILNVNSETFETSDSDLMQTKTKQKSHDYNKSLFTASLSTIRGLNCKNSTVCMAVCECTYMAVCAWQCA